MRSRSVLAPTSLVLCALLALSGCSDDPADPGAGAGATTTAAPTTTLPVPPKPVVITPVEIPTALEVTDLKVGTGPKAAEGDTVLVHYVGVVTSSGVEFDNSYDRGQPFPVENLGAASVIDGWNQGLIGVQAGTQRQLDIPTELAYGDNPPSDTIQPGDALTFVIDVVSVTNKLGPEDEPEITVAPAENRPRLKVTNLVDGTGADVDSGDTIEIEVVVFRADTGERLSSTYASGESTTFTLGDGTLGFSTIESVLTSMKVGGRKQIQVPYLDAYGEDGDESIGLPPMTDVVLIIDIVNKL